MDDPMFEFLFNAAPSSLKRTKKYRKNRGGRVPSTSLFEDDETERKKLLFTDYLMQQLYQLMPEHDQQWHTSILMAEDQKFTRYAALFQYLTHGTNRYDKKYPIREENGDS